MPTDTPNYCPLCTHCKPPPERVAEPLRGVDADVVRRMLDTSNVRPADVSVFAATIREYRELVGRDPATGVETKPTLAGTWAGALVALVWLEQVGQCFSPADVTPPKDKFIDFALRKFGEVKKPHARTVRQLRNRFAHDYTLRNAIDAPGAQQFVVTGDRSAPLVGGSFDAPIISLPALANTADRVLLALHDGLDSQTLCIHHPGGLDRVRKRFTFAMQ